MSTGLCNGKDNLYAENVKPERWLKDTIQIHKLSCPCTFSRTIKLCMYLRVKTLPFDIFFCFDCVCKLDQEFVLVKELRI